MENISRDELKEAFYCPNCEVYFNHDPKKKDKIPLSEFPKKLCGDCKS